MKNIDTCRLCLCESTLKESHIIPSSLFRFVRDKTMDDRFYEIGNNITHIVQDGPKEYLLCDKCEQKIGKYEKYHKESIHLSRHGIKIVHDGKIAIIQNLTYEKVKLFLLSLLWRMGISNLPQFSNISLTTHEDDLRKIIFEEKTVKCHEYPIAAIIPLINGKMDESWMCFPITSQNSYGPIYHMVIGGILYSISTTRLDAGFNKYLLNETGSWVIPLIDLFKINFLKSMIVKNFGK
jgi:hypothetical protein